MHQNESTDIVVLLKDLCDELRIIAAQRSITLVYAAGGERIMVNYPPQDLLPGFKRLIFDIIDYLPDNSSIDLTSEVIEMRESTCVSIKIHNTGINLRQVHAITKKSPLPVALFSCAAKETTFEIRYALHVKPHTTTTQQNFGPFNYTNFIRDIKTHFSRLNSPIERLTETNPREAAFLLKINACILKNMDNEQFDANALSNDMAISRAQLLRRLKSITGNSPAYYIKNVRLTKAKDLLETSDISISEAAFQTGFNSPSNFTKVFTEKYGITPSQFRHPKLHATNE
jgi:AraC-like DNA-binding protein